MSSFEFFDRLLNILFPSKCPTCGGISDSHIYNPICSGCWGKIERYIGYSCSICGIPVISEYATVCENCLKGVPFKKVLYYGIYEGVLKEAIHLLKFNKIKRLSKPLSTLFLDLPIPQADGLVAVPLYSKKLKEREFNQTALISNALSKELKIPFFSNALFKVKETPPQTGLKREERLKNLKNAFSASEMVKGLDLMLIDDVITTGTTVTECSKALIKAGAKNIYVLALARSMKNT
jgi:competence protein ComFC